MNIAYIILAHKLPEQLIRLIDRLNTIDCDFFIHIDKRSKENIYNQVVKSTVSYKNVYFIKRYEYKWAQFGSIRATLDSINTVLSSHKTYDYTILLTGQDYPIKSNQLIFDKLASQKYFSYMHYFSSPHPLAFQWMDRIKYWHLVYRRWHLIFPKKDMFYNQRINILWNSLAKYLNYERKIPGDLEPFFGSAYWCFTNEALNYIKNYCSLNRSYFKFFKCVWMPDEIFFQTILLNSNLKSKVINDDLHYIDFSEHKSHPKILTSTDFQKLEVSNDLFARKFDSTVNKFVLDLIDEKLI